MANKFYDKKQQQIIDSFFKEFFTWSADNIGYWIVAGLFIFIHSIFILIPYQEMKNFEANYSQFFLYIGYLQYLMPYVQFTEKGSVTRLYPKIKYLPVSHTQLRIYRLKKLTTLFLRVFPVLLIGQLFFAWVVCHEITLANILYPLLFGFLFPYGISALCAWFVG